ncbi:MAG: NAD-binding protein, partial [Shewanellaceae bacterium]|nr:NAD-binding protein [Shewanellaceae bacterium]
QDGIKGAEMLVPLVFSVIIDTVIVQSITSRWLVKLLKVESQRSKHIFIFGANVFARTFALELKAKGMKVTLADPNWENTSAARMDGLEVYYGNPATESTRWRIKFTSFGKVFVLSPYHQLNLLIIYFFEDMLGSKRIFSLVSLEEQSRRQRYKTSAEMDDLFSGISYQQLNRAMKQGGQIKTTRMTENFTYADFEAGISQAYVPLVLFQKNSFRLIRSAQFKIAAGEELMYLLLPDSVEHQLP